MVSDWLRPPSPPPSFITLIRRNVHTSAAPPAPLLRSRSRSIGTGAPPNPWEGERWIITQVLFGYGLDATSNRRPVTVSSRCHKLFSFCCFSDEFCKEAKGSQIKTVITQLDLGLNLFTCSCMHSAQTQSFKFGLQHEAVAAL